jgi:hypothetical protein
MAVTSGSSIVDEAGGAVVCLGTRMNSAVAKLAPLRRATKVAAFEHIMALEAVVKHVKTVGLSYTDHNI